MEGTDMMRQNNFLEDQWTHLFFAQCQTTKQMTGVQQL
jgi:hypothetical protein